MGFLDGFKRITSKLGSGVKNVSNLVTGGIKKVKEVASRVKNVVKQIPVIGEDLANIGDTAVNMPIPFIGKSAKELTDTAEKYAEAGRNIGTRLEDLSR